MKRLVAALILALAAALLVGVSPASAVGNKKCDTNSPQWDVDICARTNASLQTDGTGYRLDSVRVWAQGDPSTLEDCPAFITRVYLYKGNGELQSWYAGTACNISDYSVLVDEFNGKRIGPNAYIKVWAQMYDNGDPDPDPAWVTLDVIG